MLLTLQIKSGVTKTGHVCERDLDEYVANNWMKAALYLEGFPIKKVKDNSAITIGDMFENAVNFHFKDYGV